MAVAEWTERKADEQRLKRFNRALERETRRAPKSLADDLPRNY